MTKKAASVLTTLLGLAVIGVLLFVLPGLVVLHIKSIVSVLFIVCVVATAGIALVLFPLLTIGKTRSASEKILSYAIVPFALFAIAIGLGITYSEWGRWGVIIGGLMLGIGFIPLGFVAGLLGGDYGGVFLMIASLILPYIISRVSVFVPVLLTSKQKTVTNRRESEFVPINNADLDCSNGSNSVNLGLGAASDVAKENVIENLKFDLSSPKLSQAAVRDVIVNKWYESDDFVDLADFPLEFIQAVGCKPLIIKMGETSPRETVIFVTPLPNDESFFSRKLQFSMKAGFCSTSYGDIIWVLFVFENDANAKISFEVFYNPFKSLDIEQLTLLSKQKYWHFVFVTTRGDVLDVVEYVNTYSMEKVVDEIRTRTLIDAGDNYRFAVLEFQKEHALNLV